MELTRRTYARAIGRSERKERYLHLVRKVNSGQDLEVWIPTHAAYLEQKRKTQLLKARKRRELK